MTEQPDGTAVRVALWRALHVEIDPPPHVLEDRVGLALVAPEAGWRERGDMHPQGTARFRASIVARACYIEDLVVEQAGRGTTQYVLLGAGLDSFAQRRPEVAARLAVYEIDRAEPQAWKRRRLTALAYGVPDWLHLVPVDFESPGGWLVPLRAAGFDAGRPAIITSTGVSMYLTRDAILVMLRAVASLAPGTSFAMTFMRPLALTDPEERPGYERALQGAKASGTPFLSFFAPDEIVALAESCGFRDVRHVGADLLNRLYFAGRRDGLRTSNAEEMIVART